ncbi:leucine-rich repeat domain-containing protein [Bacteroidales bacterium OttesenSCG-928-M06]|nr:leucine-rich repeat domain-containing protein [Bacteroidales bacterium OttesenSCG-928-M06]
MKRKLLTVLMYVMCVVSIFAQSGTAGDLTWTFNETTGELKVEGKGEMPDYYNKQPWYDYLSSIKSISIGNEITSIGFGAFSKCSSLTEINIPNSVNGIGGSAFSECSSLTTINIPEEVEYVDDRAFNNTPWYDNQPDGIIYIGKALYKQKGHLESQDVEVKPGTVSISFNAFRNNIQLASITIPESVVYIAGRAFQDCTSLTSVILSEGLEGIDDSAFEGCRSLETIILPSSLVYLGNEVFYGCSGLKTVILGKSIESIDFGAFTGCGSLESILVDKENLKYTSEGGVLFDKKKEVLSIYPGGLKGKYTIPNSVKTIGYGAFYASDLTSVIIPNSVTKIESVAFKYCRSLTSITIPVSVKSIDSEAFYDCSSLAQVQVNWNKPLSISPEIFNIDMIKKCTLYVPAGTKSLYEQAKGWLNFGTIIEGEMPTSIDNPETSNNIYISGNTLYTYTPVSETITIYSVTGELLYTFAKPAGEASFTLNNTKNQMLIVRTESGVTKKLINR